MNVLVIAMSVIGAGVIVFVLISRPENTMPPSDVATVASPCPDSVVLTTPVDTSLVTAMLWPGQSRGGDFKGHGGFRFDTSNPDDVSVHAPLDARLTDAGRYLANGDEQYLLFFSSACGLTFRFDHIRTLSPKLVAALADLPPAKPNDSRTTKLTKLVEVTAGEEISHSVGIATSANVFVDFGLYRDTPDTASGLCFFDYLPPADSIYLRSLPTGNEGKTSAYCN